MSFFNYIGDIFLNIPKVYRELRQTIASEVRSDEDIKVVIIIISVFGIIASIGSVTTCTPLELIVGVLFAGWFLFVIMLIANTLTRLSYDEEYEVSKRNKKPATISYLITCAIISVIVFAIFICIAAITIAPLWLIS